MQVTIPRADTTYWCQSLEFPENIRNSTKHIVKVGKKKSSTVRQACPSQYNYCGTSLLWIFSDNLIKRDLLIKFQLGIIFTFYVIRINNNIHSVLIKRGHSPHQFRGVLLEGFCYTVGIMPICTAPIFNVDLSACVHSVVSKII